MEPRRPWAAASRSRGVFPRDLEALDHCRHPSPRSPRMCEYLGRYLPIHPTSGLITATGGRTAWARTLRVVPWPLMETEQCHRSHGPFLPMWLFPLGTPAMGILRRDVKWLHRTLCASSCLSVPPRLCGIRCLARKWAGSSPTTSHSQGASHASTSLPGRDGA